MLIEPLVLLVLGLALGVIGAFAATAVMAVGASAAVAGAVWLALTLRRLGRTADAWKPRR